MAKKKPDIFEGYGKDYVVLEQKPFNIEDLQKSFDKIAKASSPPAPIMLPTDTLEEFRKIFNPDYRKKYYANCTKFQDLFHKGVIFEHIGSKVRWEVVSTYKNYSTGEVRCKIKSLSSNTVKHLINSDYNHYTAINVPKAVAVLFGHCDEK